MSRNSRKDVDYNHDQNRHTAAGAASALIALLDDPLPPSLLDVGCGTGTWLKAALDIGIPVVRGIDGIALAPDLLHVSQALITSHDLRGDWRVEKAYDLVLCLEVAEHLPPECAAKFIRKLTGCGDRIFFSAACPWQEGQGHVNCQWPDYWQGLFNSSGFVCRDVLRWKLWHDARIEPWYRQNVFLAEKDEAAAGNEVRIPAVVHPDCMQSACCYWRNGQTSLLELVARSVDRGVRRAFGMNTYE